MYATKEAVVAVPVAIWMTESQPARLGLSRDRIVRAAIELADTDGVAALSMRRIAVSLSAGTMSLYRHVPGKDELLELMVDAVLGETPPPGDGEWRARALAGACRLRDLSLRHPWLPELLVAQPAMGPNALRGFESAVGPFRDLGCDITTASSIVSTVQGHVLGVVLRELAAGEMWRRAGMSQDEWRRHVGPYVRRVIDEGQHPRFAEFVVDGEDQDYAERFAFGLECLLDGIAVRLDRMR
jgi:AcrR family transcriptional regulator